MRALRHINALRRIEHSLVSSRVPLSLCCPLSHLSSSSFSSSVSTSGSSILSRHFCTSPASSITSSITPSISSSPVDPKLVNTAAKHISTLLQTSIKPNKHVILLYDKQCGLSDILSQGYTEALKQLQGSNTITGHEVIDFDQSSPEVILNKFAALSEGDLVVLVETTSFRLTDYRIRIELFKRQIKNVEHVHLGLIDPVQYPAYVESLYFTPTESGALSRYIKNEIDNAKHIVVECGQGTKLEINSEMEPSLLNIGDYEGMKNVGGTFPIGEVFSEPKDLTKVNGDVMVFGYPNTNYKIETHKVPFRVQIKDGFLVDIDENSTNVPESFKKVMNIIKENEQTIIVREFGIGLNKAMGKDRPVNDGTSFERQKGLHLSLGKKHNVFKKPGMKNARFHVDVFLDVQKIVIDGKTLYQDGDFCYSQK